MFGYVDGTCPGGYDAGVIGGNTLYWPMEPDDLFECKNDVKGDVARHPALRLLPLAAAESVFRYGGGEPPRDG